MENYQIQHKIGSGNYAKVYLARHATTNQEVRKDHSLHSNLASAGYIHTNSKNSTLSFLDPLQVALKLISKNALKNSKASDRIQKEMANMKTLSGHENIVTLHDCKFIATASNTHTLQAKWRKDAKV